MCLPFYLCTAVTETIHQWSVQSAERERTGVQDDLMLKVLLKHCQGERGIYQYACHDVMPPQF